MDWTDAKIEDAGFTIGRRPREIAFTLTRERNAACVNGHTFAANAQSEPCPMCGQFIVSIVLIG